MREKKKEKKKETLLERERERGGDARKEERERTRGILEAAMSGVDFGTSKLVGPAGLAGDPRTNIWFASPLGF